MSWMNSRRSGIREYKCDFIKEVSLRQVIVPGWSQEKLSQARVLFAGAGGLNGEVIEGFVRKGGGEAHVCDHDTVSKSNLNRQKFYKRDLYKNKAIHLCKNMKNQGYLGTRLFAYPRSFQDLGIAQINPMIIVCGVDNQIEGTRSEVAQVASQLEIPAIIYAVSTDASYGYVFVQEPGKACWGCVFKPELTASDTTRSNSSKTCAPSPACCDILKALAGHVLYALDSLLMDRKRDWNYRVISLDRSEMLISKHVSKREGCELCHRAQLNR